MKNPILNSLLTCSLAVLIGNTPLAAQPRQTASIPFPFEAGGMGLPEGNYMVQRILNSQVVKLTNVATGHSAMIQAPVLAGQATSSASKLLFRQKGESLTLTEVWFPDYPGMLTISGSHDLSAKVVVHLK